MGAWGQRSEGGDGRRRSINMSDQEKMLEGRRAAIFSGEDRDLYLHVGYFFAWYNHVEWKISNLMAVIMGERDFTAFEVLIGRLEGRTKVERFKRLCKIKKRVIEQSLLDRLDHYEKNICKLRNTLAHHALARDERKPRFYFLKLDRLPWAALGMVAPDGAQPPPDHINAITLFEQGHWLDAFADDLTEVFNTAIENRPLGISKPRSPLPRKY
jgi:hypothetical protein